MKAASYAGHRTFNVTDCQPIPPGRGEIRINVAYSGICGTDLHVFHGAMDHRVRIPQVIGHEMSGTVGEVGEDVYGFSAGDPIVVRPLDNRGETPADRGYSHICHKLRFMGIDSPGSFQSSWTVPAFTVHKLPAHLDLQIGALTEPLAVACHDVKMGEVKPGELAVVIGGGPIGMLVAMVARHAGARVVVSEINEYRLHFARSLGFEALSPTETDLSEWLREQSNGSGADIVFEASGASAAAMAMSDLPAIRGRVVLVGVHPKPTEINLFQFFWKELKLIGARVYEPDDYQRAIELMASGVLPLANMITEVQPLENVQHAFERLEALPSSMKVLLDCRA